MTKIRVKLIAVREFTFSSEMYPGMSLEEAISYEEEYAKDQPSEFVDGLVTLTVHTSAVEGAS